MIGRLDPQKGFDLLHGAAERLLAGGARLVVQGSGTPELAGGFRALAAAKPDRVSLIERFDRAMARRIYAGADLFLMPSRFEPCGTGQMVSLRYGTPPIVRRTGGLADTVIDERTEPGRGTGFVFDDATSEALAAACEDAMAMRARGGAAWDGLIQRGMAVDFDWVRGSAPQYLALYERAVAIRRAAASG
jgi:starch synthase